MLRGYDISPEIKTTVDIEISNYYAYKYDIDEIEEELSKVDYMMVPIQSYDRIYTSPTNNITRTQELFTIRNSDKRSRRDQLLFIINAIDTGIKRAAYTTTRLDLAEGIRIDLFANMVDKKPRYYFERTTRTFQKYRRRAYYYIAEELGLLSLDS